ncbi:MAG: pseudouridine synthase [Flexilinea sp.]
MEERLQKIMARSGFGSRRSCEEIIREGRVIVNGNTAVLGSKADPTKDKIQIDGSLLEYREPEKVYIAVYKPRFVLSDRPADDPRQTVFSLVPDSDDLFVVGRLDFESEGLVLLTNDGELANKLSHPRYGKEKEYHVLVSKRPDEDQMAKWRRGIVLEDGEKTAPADVKILKFQGDGAWLRVIMREGRKREIREIGKQIGLPIVKLVRVRIGTVKLGGLKPKEWVFLKDAEIQELRDLVSKKPVMRERENAPQKTVRAKEESRTKTPPGKGIKSEPRSRTFPAKPPFRTNGAKKKPK